MCAREKRREEGERRGEGEKDREIDTEQREGMACRGCVDGV